MNFVSRQRCQILQNLIWVLQLLKRLVQGFFVLRRAHQLTHGQVGSYNEKLPITSRIGCKEIFKKPFDPFWMLPFFLLCSLYSFEILPHARDRRSNRFPPKKITQRTAKAHQPKQRPQRMRPTTVADLVFAFVVVHGFCPFRWTSCRHQNCRATLLGGLLFAQHWVTGSSWSLSRQMQWWPFPQSSMTVQWWLLAADLSMSQRFLSLAVALKHQTGFWEQILSQAVKLFYASKTSWQPTRTFRTLWFHGVVVVVLVLYSPSRNRSSRSSRSSRSIVVV